MKFHKLTVENMNSLYGKHIIDFDAHLAQASLFLIMGPIGAGKSTILDAICLAIFGTTPRQQNAGSPAATAEQIMSRGTGFTEITLEFSRLDPEKGRLRYRAGWYCQRARKNPTGNIQPPRRSLDRLDKAGWQPIINDHRVSYYEPHFNEALAEMELHDFLRSVLLAQGEFTAFLKADHQAKAQILEKLTDTGQYLQIGQRASQRWSKAKQAVESLKQRVQDVQLRSDEEFAALKQSQIELARRAADQQQTVEAARQHTTWVQNLHTLQKDLEQAQLTLQTATTAKEDRQPDFARAKMAEQARQPATIATQRATLLKEIETHQKQITGLQNNLASLKTEEKAARSILAEKKAALKTQQEHWDAQQSPIRQARALYERLKLTRQTQQEAQQKYDQAQQALHTTQTQLTDHNLARQKAKEKTEAARQALKKLEDLQNLPELLSGLSARITHLQRLHQQAESTRDQTKAQITALDAFRLARERKQQDLASRQAELEPLQNALDAAEQTLIDLLQGAADTAARRQALQTNLEQLNQTWRVKQDAQQRLPDWLTEQEKLASIQSELHTAEKERLELSTRLEKLEKPLQDAQTLVAKCQDDLNFRKDLIRFFDERRNLTPHEPCPVCGSKEHPFADQNFDDTRLQNDRDQAQQALDQAHLALKNLEADQNKWRIDQSVLETNISNLNARQQDHKSSLDARTTSLSSLADKLSTTFDPEEPQRFAAFLERKDSELTGALPAAKQALADLDQAERAQKSAADALLKESRALDELKNQIAIDQIKLENLQTTLQAQQKREEDAKKELENAQKQLAQDFTDAHISSPFATLQDFEAALDSAREKAALYQQSAQALLEAQQAEEKTTQALKALQALLPEREKTHQEALENLQTLQTTVATLKEQTLQALGGEDPDTFEEKLKQALARAQAAQDNAHQAVHRIERKLEGTQAQLNSAQTTQQDRQLKLQDLQSELDKALKQAGFPDLDALRKAFIPEAKLEALKQDLTTLTNNHLRAQTSVERAEQALLAHRKARPQDLPEDSEHTELTVFQQALQQAEEANMALNNELAVTRSEIEREETQRQRASTLSSELAAAQQEFNRWDVIHRLIGQNKGENFQKFAQALNLERIVFHANQHLQHLHERYRLAVARDEYNNPTLDFEMVDTYRPNTTRAISTLSGGESFLVSLALALALADFRQVHMSVETLLLDEGFGTLDQDSLADAVKVLTSLHNRDRRQVGIISHVEHLQEQIEHRIIVEPRGGGMSTIKVD